MYNIRLKWLTITCFELQFGDTTVVTDPCIGASPFNGLTWEDIERCDIITLSHCHWDHITDIPALMRKFPVPLLTGSLSAMPMLQWVDCDPTRVYPMDANVGYYTGEYPRRKPIQGGCFRLFLYPFFLLQHPLTCTDSHRYFSTKVALL